MVASAISAGLAHRSWAITPAPRDPRCQAFLFRHGEALLTATEGTAGPGAGAEGGAGIELTAPTLVWLPPGASADLRLLAGGDGAMFTTSETLAWRSVGDSAVGLQLRPLLTRTLVVPSEAIGPHLAELQVGFDAIIRESRDQGVGANAMISAHLTLILLHLWRASGDAERLPAPRGAGSATLHQFRQLVELLYREHLTIDDYAARLGVTRAHLHETCLRQTGRTPLALVHERLLAEARRRLLQTTLTVEQISYGLGFRDPGYFNRFFKRATGQPPGAYRKQARVEQAPDAPVSYAAWP